MPILSLSFSFVFDFISHLVQYYDFSFTSSLYLTLFRPLSLPITHYLYSSHSHSSPSLLIQFSLSFPCFLLIGLPFPLFKLLFDWAIQIAWRDIKQQFEVDNENNNENKKMRFKDLSGYKTDKKKTRNQRKKILEKRK